MTTRKIVIDCPRCGAVGKAILKIDTFDDGYEKERDYFFCQYCGKISNNPNYESIEL